LNQSQQQRGNPEHVVVREERKQAQDRHHLHLHVVHTMRHALG
jgi:hypothetical protein